MYTSRSYVINYELYKVLAMKVDELHSTVGIDEDVDALRLENKDLRELLAFSEDARARSIYNITKAKMIQRACVQVQRKAESQLRSCQNMIHAKDKELIEALTELSKAQGLLANLEVPSYADPMGPPGVKGHVGLHGDRGNQRFLPSLVELDPSSSSQSDSHEAAAEVISAGIKKLEKAIHRIVVRRSAPYWLLFLPGHSYWVPPSNSNGIM
ncbi:uncharacterized protein Fot_28506 [Forsythia ovata]|uniref:Uncharacterized protein n=1 Tax=Forsythia ovata TaxID=205694 RepID=A0ABD1TQ23_9LAMI